jgi:hypothetical protein
MKIIMILLSIVLFSCNRKIPNEGKIPMENENAVYDNTVNIAGDEKENIGAVETGQNLETNNIGIYFPEYYINALNTKKSHIAASKEYYQLNSGRKNSIIIFRDEVMNIFNYHEGETVKILDITGNEILLENIFNQGYKINIIDGDTVTDENNVVFTRIGNDVENFHESIAAYITLAMFGENIYRNDNGEEMVRLENGNILKNNVEYELFTDTFFLTEYDCIFSRNRNENRRTVFFRINNGMIEVYNQEMQEGYPEEYLDTPFENPYPKYVLADIYKCEIVSAI